MNEKHAKLALFVVQQEARRLRKDNPNYIDNPLYAQLIGTAASLRREVKNASA